MKTERNIKHKGMNSSQINTNKLNAIQQKILDNQLNADVSKYHFPEEIVRDLKQKYDLYVFSLPSEEL